MPGESQGGCSRRGFVSGAVLLALHPRAASAALQRSVAPKAPPTDIARATALLHTTDDSMGRMTTATFVDRSGPYRFLVDTGAARSVIAADLTASLRLPVLSDVLVEGILRDEQSKLVSIARLAVGPLRYSGLAVPILPRSELGADGYLGLDVLDGRRVILDFKTGTLTVTRPRSFFASMWIDSNEVVIHTLGGSGRLRSSDCHVDGARCAAFIDTGAAISVGNSALYEALLRRRPDLRRRTAVLRLTGATGGSINASLIVAPQIVFGALRFRNIPIAVADLEVFTNWGLADQPALLLGMSALRLLNRVSIDYERKQLRFELPRRS